MRYHNENIGQELTRKGVKKAVLIPPPNDISFNPPQGTGDTFKLYCKSGNRYTDLSVKENRKKIMEGKAEYIV